MLPALQKAVEHPDMTEDLAVVLSTSMVDVKYEVSTGVRVREYSDQRMFSYFPTYQLSDPNDFA